MLVVLANENYDHFCRLLFMMYFILLLGTECFLLGQWLRPICCTLPISGATKHLEQKGFLWTSSCFRSQGSWWLLCDPGFLSFPLCPSELIIFHVRLPSVRACMYRHHLFERFYAFTGTIWLLWFLLCWYLLSYIRPLISKTKHSTTGRQKASFPPVLYLKYLLLLSWHSQYDYLQPKSGLLPETKKLMSLAYFLLTLNPLIYSLYANE